MLRLTFSQRKLVGNHETSSQLLSFVAFNALLCNRLVGVRCRLCGVDSMVMNNLLQLAVSVQPCRG